MKPSLQDVARRARVSTATVSRVLNGAGLVKDGTRQRVLKAVQALHYEPNLNARSLARGESRTIGMLVSNMENPFFWDIFSALEAEAIRCGYEVVVANTDYRAERLGRSIHAMLGRRVAGVAAIVSEMDPACLRSLLSSQVPVVFYDVGSARKNISNIRVNYRRGVEKVVRYLHDLGHREIAFVGHHASLDPLGERTRAFRAAVAMASPPVEARIAMNLDGMDGGRRAASEVLDSGFLPTAFVCANDFMAVGVLRELRERGLRVPRDVSVTGFDNIRLSEYCDPPLTTVHIPREMIGRTAFDCLVGGGAPVGSAGREIQIDTEFVVRESTGPSRALQARPTAVSRKTENRKTVVRKAVVRKTGHRNSGRPSVPPTHGVPRMTSVRHEVEHGAGNTKEDRS